MAKVTREMKFQITNETERCLDVIAATMKSVSEMPEHLRTALTTEEALRIVAKKIVEHSPYIEHNPQLWEKVPK